MGRTWLRAWAQFICGLWVRLGSYSGHDIETRGCHGLVGCLGHNLVACSKYGFDVCSEYNLCLCHKHDLHMCSGHDLVACSEHGLCPCHDHVNGQDLVCVQPTTCVLAVSTA
ncbi:hypothetical protein Fot_03754 [Forsythia ovata]|uniref:Secreted protein n=1 Tax=Forsythia ovata TaxID=205694 RepID=A0ABD1XBH1_9LAMI